jgi:chemotaxis protein methyltransferase CheR
MSDRFTADEIARIAGFVQQHIGFSYADARTGDLIRGFCAACKDMGCVTGDECLSLLIDPDQSGVLKELLVKKLTIGETYFFRDRRLFTHLCTTLLPELIQSRRSGRKYLRIWCAACSSGEEPYSLAILLKYLIPDIDSWDITLLATDINTGSLHAAERGVYSKWSFREEAPVSLTPYVTPSQDGRFEVSPDIKKMVRFSRLNLITDAYPSTLTGTTTMDLILCRNVLMYFSPDLAGEVIDRLHDALITGGWLIVSPQEISYAQRPGFVQVKQSSVFLFRKGAAAEETRPRMFGAGQSFR